jgi:hypothetical protein
MAMCLFILFLCAVPLFSQSPPAGQADAAGIMAKVAENVERAADARKQFVYHQLVRSSLVRSNGQVARREKREFSVFPGEKGTEKKLTSFTGEYRKGKQMIAYSEPGHKYKGMDVDGDLITELTDSLVNDKNSRDGIPHSLFPISTKDLPSYRFTMKGRSEIQGRPAYQIAFEPVRKESCITIGSEDDECDSPPWMGDAWIDVAELQPVQILTHLAVKVPWGIRVFLGTNIRQTGFAITYVRAAENVWFPATYGTEFHLNMLWGYKRTITLSMESNGFQRTDANSKIEYQLPPQ